MGAELNEFWTVNVTIACSRTCVGVIFFLIAGDLQYRLRDCLPDRWCFGVPGIHTYETAVLSAALVWGDECAVGDYIVHVPVAD